MVRRLAIGLVLLAMCVSGLGAGPQGAARADVGWFIRHGVTYPPEYVAGPFESYARCEKVKAAYGYDYRYYCEQKVY